MHFAHFINFYNNYFYQSSTKTKKCSFYSLQQQQYSTTTYMSSRISYPVTAGMSNDYKSFDRSTRAGRLLHNLYTAPTKDSTLDKDLLKRLEQQRKQREAMEQPKPKPVPKSRAYVEIPQAPPKEYPKYLPPISRRPLKQIQENEKEETAKYQKRLQQEYEKNPSAHQARTEEDKFRLQHKFQFGVEPSDNLVQAFNAERTRVAGTVAEGTGITQPFAFSAASAAREKRFERERQLWMKRFDEINVAIAEKKQEMSELDGDIHQQELTAALAAAASGTSKKNNTASVASVISGNKAGGVHQQTSLANNKGMNAAREKRQRLANEIKDLVNEMKEVDQNLKELDSRQ